jgi:GNAT superfamily N-acetyltransferase
MLRSGQEVLVRPIRAQDSEGLLEGFQQLSPESRYRRFLAPQPTLGRAQLRYLTEVDHHDHEALLAIDPLTRNGLGVARFVRSRENPSVAEVAVAVADDWQGRGLGTTLLQELAGRAREEGVSRFSATVLADNSGVIEMVFKLGDAEVTSRHDGVIDLVMELPRSGLPRSLREALRAAAHGDLRLSRSWFSRSR